VLTIGVAWWGIFTALTASLSSTTSGALSYPILIRLLLGAGEAIVYPGTTSACFASIVLSGGVGALYLAQSSY
jgi:hypothetical protein